MTTGEDDAGPDQDPDQDQAPDDADGSSFTDHLDRATTQLDTAAEDPTEQSLMRVLEALEPAADAAVTEADLDAVETLLDETAGLIDGLDLPEPEDEDADHPQDVLESRADDIRGTIDDKRGPYAEDVTRQIAEHETTVTDTRWTEDGHTQTTDAVTAFTDTVNAILDTSLDPPADHDGIPDALAAIRDVVDAADLHPDDDADTIAALLEATDTLGTGLEDAEEWADLPTREQLRREGFYDVIEHAKDFPPEWQALKMWEARGNVDMILLALDSLGMDFMEQHCLNALKRLADEAAMDAMLQRAQRRDTDAIEVLGKIGNPDAIDTIIDFVDADTNPQLQMTAIKAIGEIGSPDTTERVATKLTSDSERVRATTARALGLIGDPRAINPLETTLATDDSPVVRGAAAWALAQIATQRALTVLADYRHDPVYLVKNQATHATDALDQPA